MAKSISSVKTRPGPGTSTSASAECGTWFTYDGGVSRATVVERKGAAYVDRSTNTSRTIAALNSAAVNPARPRETEVRRTRNASSQGKTCQMPNQKSSDWLAAHAMMRSTTAAAMPAVTPAGFHELESGGAVGQASSSVVAARIAVRETKEKNIACRNTEKVEDRQLNEQTEKRIRIAQSQRER